MEKSAFSSGSRLGTMEAPFKNDGNESSFVGGADFLDEERGRRGKQISNCCMRARRVGRRDVEYPFQI